MAQTQTSTTTSTSHPKTATATHSTATGHPGTAVHRAAAKPAGVALTTDEQKTVYALGLMLYQRSLVQLDLTSDQLAIVKQAITDSAAGKPAENLDDFKEKVQPFAMKRLTDHSKAASDGLLSKAAAEPGASKTGSGLIYRDVRVGTGASPKATDTVKVNYRGTLGDGNEFDSSYKRNTPAQFPLDHVIKCWTEGVQKMKVGGKAVLVCPSDLAYGDRGQSAIPPNSALRFEVELLEILPPGATPATPAPQGAHITPAAPNSTPQ